MISGWSFWSESQGRTPNDSDSNVFFTKTGTCYQNDQGPTGEFSVAWKEKDENMKHAILNLGNNISGGALCSPS